ncbi:MAG: RNA-binding transcriptional accessory protein [Leptospiraceae bacterium]|nr:RNA-binding transcriptional accessory protein [Leptospiraceae bacterium]
MDSFIIQEISEELRLKPGQVEAVLELLEDSNTIPFIARYRKEKTGSLDEVQITQIRDLHEKLKELLKRKTSILDSLQKRELLNPNLQEEIKKAKTLAELEDIYLPYKPKRKTRASIAIEKGLQPIALSIYSQTNSFNPKKEAEKLLQEKPELESVDKILSGARDIIAEMISEDKKTRTLLRKVYADNAIIESSKKTKIEKEGAEKYEDYFELKTPLKDCPARRILAIFRGEKEAFLKVSVEPSKEICLSSLKSLHIKGRNPSSEEVLLSIEDSYKRLLQPSLETELRNSLKEKADIDSIQIFAENLRQLLYAAPLGNKAILALDPGFRTGCKLVCLDPQGKLLYHTAIYPHKPQERTEEAKNIILELVDKYAIEVIAVGNGTAGRETESFASSLPFFKKLPVVMVNESGASIYSASEVAREEFPNEDVTVRGAVSIGRRLMDPLAELVKINPRSIGVGQYQHDVDQSLLKKKLEEVVESCVNRVGVDLNTCSKELLAYVSGLGTSLAKKIIAYRNDKGKFQSRQDLKKISGLGAKAFEQAAGFLRIRAAKNPLDDSAVHPESYGIVENIANKMQTSIQELIGNERLLKSVKPQDFVTETIGLPSLKDILSELSRPGRDPRDSFEFFEFARGVETIEDLKPGMNLPGIVTNLTAFGAFVDIGVHQDGLIHISQISNTFIKNPAEVLHLQQKLRVKVLDVDVKRKRISLSLKEA